MKNITKTTLSIVHCALCIAVAFAANAATTYAVPWYANPTAVSIADANAQAAALEAAATANASAYATRLAAVNAENGTSYAGTLRMSLSAYFRPRLYILGKNGSLT
ncbi:MAG: hypothetical protein IJK04_13535, partial [Kiritimatiellae bacterium]|nr:hypothetical protein [Kiritimatiellia bacterium]